MKSLVLIVILSAASSTCAAEALVKLVLGQASAKPNTRLVSGSTFSTGKKSRSEVVLDSGVFRTGSDTAVQIGAGDSLSLSKGLALVSAKPKLFRGSVNVSTPGYGMKVRGTAQIYHDPGRSIRIVVLEGEVTVSLGSLRGERVTLRRGQELIINPTDKQLPTPVEVDLNRLMTTMALLDQRAFPKLPSSERVTESARVQQEEIVEGDELMATELVMADAGPDIDVRTEEMIHDEVNEEIDDLDGDGEEDPDVELVEDGVPIDDEDEAATADDGGDAGGDEGDPEARRRPGAARSGTKSRSISFNNQRVSGDSVTIGSGKARTRIQITNSSEVAALAGALRVLNKGGSIVVDGSTLRATGQILMDGSASNSGFISLRNATLNAATIKARAFGTGADALVIDGSTLNADQMIELYADGASTLRFRNQVTLNTNQAIIAGKTVEVDAGGRVDVRGRADVYTDSARFNTSGYGTINAGGGVTTRPFSGTPAH